MAIPLVAKIQQHTAAMGPKGKIDLARLALKFGKRLDDATPADEPKLKAIVKEVLGKDL